MGCVDISGIYGIFPGSVDDRGTGSFDGTWDAGVKMSFVFQILQGLLVKCITSNKWHFVLIFVCGN